MKLILLHGPPAAGKLTVANYLSAMVGAKVLHNHLTIDLALSIYDEFGQEDFFAFSNKLRRIAISKAHERGVKHLVLTFCYSSPEDNELVNQYLKLCNDRKIDFYPVFVCPTLDHLLERAQAEGRQNSSKLSDPDQLSKLIEKDNFCPIDNPQTMSFDNSEMSAETVASKIVETLNLKPQ